MEKRLGFMRLHSLLKISIAYRALLLLALAAGTESNQDLREDWLVTEDEKTSTVRFNCSSRHIAPFNLLSSQGVSFNWTIHEGCPEVDAVIKEVCIVVVLR
ncbi:unnamed protein product [Protopolystoma xenopodis]|uniref:Uncharacterized protein n=1 Tax=Protopolystoma xenopodis TaxID=117903 RepID=A0A3S5CSB6_9PLAT|nr:unnamed protein product [Protopolystoma xenopodis]